MARVKSQVFKSMQNLCMTLESKVMDAIFQKRQKSAKNFKIWAKM